jgi:hypothetical protein
VGGEGAKKCWRQMIYWGFLWKVRSQGLEIFMFFFWNLTIWKKLFEIFILFLVFKKKIKIFPLFQPSNPIVLFFASIPSQKPHMRPIIFNFSSPLFLSDLNSSQQRQPQFTRIKKMKIHFRPFVRPPSKIHGSLVIIKNIPIDYWKMVIDS